jgi:hypothetical protein
MSAPQCTASPQVPTAAVHEELRRALQNCLSVVNNLKEVVFQTDATGPWTFLNPS